MVFLRPSGAWAQIEPGTVVSDFSVPDINGQNWQLYSLLAQGKVVYLEISATWCPPCWSYHSGGAMHYLYEVHGPNGDDRARVLFVEGDPATNIACLYGDPGCNGVTLGNWVDGTPFPIIDNAAIADSFQIKYYPSLFVICPNRRAYEVAHTDAATLWEASKVCPVAFGADNAGIFGFDAGSPLLELCDTLDLQPQFQLINLGSNALTQAKIDLVWEGGVVQTKYWNGNLGLYAEAPIVFDPIGLADVGTLGVSITEVNGALGDNDASDNEVERSYNLAKTFDSQAILLRLKTDAYGEETYWEVRDEAGNVLKHGGNEYVGPTGGGSIFAEIGPGAYADNVIIKDTIQLPVGGCYSFHLVDAYGDGICCGFGNGFYKFYNLNLPGAPVIEGGQFKAYEDRSIAFDQAVSTTEQTMEDVAALELYPNPSTDLLYMDCHLGEATPIQCDILDPVGRMVHTFSVGNQPSGLFSRQIRVADWPAGTYFVRWMAGGKIQTTRFLHVR